MQNRIEAAAHAMTGSGEDYDPLIERVGDARLVLLGEASHGTHEFYDARARITQRLIREKGFHAVAAEADWPDAARVHAYLQGRGTDNTPDQALASFERFPRWMWRNTDVRDFIRWVRTHNESQLGPPVGFYGLDLYSLERSIEAVLHYLKRVDPAAAERAQARYACFDHFGGDSESYALNTGLGLSDSCEREVIEQLIELQRRAREYATRDGWLAEDDFFSAEQNARLVKNAEEYYRGMFGGRISTWNLRDRHMADTLDALLAHLDRRLERSKVVIWEHNSHLGDARATGRAAYGEWNVGQLVRERHAQDAVLVGFTTYTGTVRAASDWNGPDMIKDVRPALRGSYELLFHESGPPAFLIVFGRGSGIGETLAGVRLERAIGVIYRPESERLSHYFEAELPRQFDAVIHFDTTRAVVALGGAEDRAPHLDEREAPETYPYGA